MFTVRTARGCTPWPWRWTHTKVHLSTTPEPCGDCCTDHLVPDTSRRQQNTKHTDRPCLDGVAARATAARCAAGTRAPWRTSPATSRDNASDAPARAERRARERARAAGKASDPLPEYSPGGAADSGGWAGRTAKREASQSRAMSSVDGRAKLGSAGEGGAIRVGR